MKRIVIMLLTTTLAVSQLANAKVIELDNKNPDHCRQQILAANPDHDPIIMTYMNGCPAATAMRPVFEKLSEEMPDRTFFAINFEDEIFPFQTYRRVSECLGKTPFMSPNFFLYMIADGEYGRYIVGDWKGGLASTKEELINFIGNDAQNNNLKKNMTLSTK